MTLPSSRTFEQKTNFDGFPKPGEIIEMTGTHTLEASDRAIFNIMYKIAHESGRLLDLTAEWQVAYSALRSAFSAHESNERLRESLLRLKAVKVNIHYVEDGEPRVTLTELFDFLDIPKKKTNKRQILRFGFARKVVPILEQSGKWGRIRLEIVCAMTSKYAIALHELVQLRANMDRCVELFLIERFRDLLGVPPGKYERVDNLMRKVIEPAVLQVNGLSDMGVAIEARRRHARAPVHEFALTWWRKQGEEFRAAVQERNRHKKGRMARLKGQVEQLAVDRVMLVNAEVADKLE
jgi:hypothetical protein